MPCGGPAGRLERPDKAPACPVEAEGHKAWCSLAPVTLENSHSSWRALCPPRTRRSVGDPWTVVVKIGTPDKCVSSFLGDASELW